MQNFSSFMDKLWQHYISYTPSAKKVFDRLQQRGETVINDHIALRTINLPGIGVDDLAKIFTPYGFRDGGQKYEFKEKKLFARHLEHDDPNLPKIFISELLLENFSPATQQTMRDAMKSVSSAQVADPNFLCSGVHWPIEHKVYQRLYQESEYAAWVYAFGFRSNHFTININALKSFAGCTDLNAFLKSEGFTLNASGGEIKGGPQEFLEQSSLMADYAPVAFLDGTATIPCCYVEFAKRFPLKNGKLYQGFVAASADKIFESTHHYK